MRALIARINRKLAAEDEVLRVSRGARQLFDLGQYYIVNTRINGITGQNMDPEGVGRELGVIKPYEEVVDGRGQWGHPR
jgi:hypothetical protein